MPLIQKVTERLGFQASWRDSRWPYRRTLMIADWSLPCSISR